MSTCPACRVWKRRPLIRQRRKSRHTPIIFVTAFADDVQTVEGYALGAVDYILTPIVPEILRAKINVFVELFRMRAELGRSHALLEQRVADRTAELEQCRRAAAHRGARAQAGRGATDDPGAGTGASREEPAVGFSVDHRTHVDRGPHHPGRARNSDRTAAIARAMPMSCSPRRPGMAPSCATSSWPRSPDFQSACRLRARLWNSVLRACRRLR